MIWTVTTGARLLEDVEYAWDRYVRKYSCPLDICDGSGICPPVRLEDNERECACRV